jgi:hypothetical protein
MFPYSNTALLLVHINWKYACTYELEAILIAANKNAVCFNFCIAQVHVKVPMPQAYVLHADPTAGMHQHHERLASCQGILLWGTCTWHVQQVCGSSSKVTDGILWHLVLFRRQQHVARSLQQHVR